MDPYNTPPVNPPRKNSTASCFLTGCVVTLLVGILCVLGGYLYLKESGAWEKLTSMVGSSMETGQAMGKLMTCPELAEAVGSPVKVQEDQSQRTASKSGASGMETEVVQIVSGPKGQATLRIGMIIGSQGMKLTKAKLVKSDGTEVDLSHHIANTEAKAPAPATNP
jgi:hypothetical protein